MNEKGFSLMEMLLVTMLMAVILGGLAAFQGTIVQQRGRVIQEILVQSQADAARKKILMELAEATKIDFPSVPTGCPPTPTWSDDLQGFKNVNPANSQPLVTAFGKTYYFRFCRGNSRLYYYWGTGSIIPAGNCGSSCGSGCMVLAGGPTASFVVQATPGAPQNAIFYRPRNNYVQVSLRVRYDPTLDPDLTRRLKETAKMGTATIDADVNTGMGLPLPNCQ